MVTLPGLPDNCTLLVPIGPYMDISNRCARCDQLKLALPESCLAMMASLPDMRQLFNFDKDCCLVCHEIEGSGVASGETVAQLANIAVKIETANNSLRFLFEKVKVYPFIFTGT